MKKKVSFMLLMPILAIAMSLVGCSTTNPNDKTSNDSSSITVDASFASTDSEMFTQRDYQATYNESGSVYIALNGSSASCSSSKVQINGTTVTIKDEGTYIFSGTLDNGMIVIDAQDSDKPQLVFNGVSVTSATSAPLYIKEADKVFITLAKDSKNKLANGGAFAAIDANNIDGAIFSKQDLTLNGDGTLEICSPVGHGIVCKDDLVFTGGAYTIEANAHGLDANDSIRITGTTLSIEAGKDGIHSENADDTTLGFVYISSGTMDITAADDGISSGAYMQISGGTLNITAGTKSTADNTSLKGLKATASILITGGNFKITASDDTIHSNGSIVVEGGEFELSSGDDAFHADEALKISAGSIDIVKSYEGLEALEIEVLGGDIRIVASDDGINAAGGNDSSGFGGMGGGMRPGEHFFGGSPSASSSSTGLITISGGNIYIKAYGDGIDANGSLTITGGAVTVCGPTSGDTAVLDYDNSGTISGGVFCGSGAYMMAQSLTGVGQGVLGVIKVGNQSAGTTVTLKDASGKEIISYTPELSFQIVIISSPDIIKGETYTLIVGSNTGTVTAK